MVDSRFQAHQCMSMVQEGSANAANLESRAAQLEDMQRLEDARDAYDAALKLQPASQSLAEGRARVALGLKEGDAVEHCRRALAYHDAYPDRQLRMILTAAVDLGSGAIPLFEDHIRRNPTDVKAHEILAELRAEHGDGERFTATYLAVLAEHPTSKPLWMSYWNSLTRAGRLDAALASMEANRNLFEGDGEFALLEANIAIHAGRVDRLRDLVDRLDDRPEARIARAQHHLQTGRAEEAAKLLESAVDAQPDNYTAWAFLEIAWRMTGDPRSGWLAAQPGLIGTRELSLSASQLADIAAALRSMHRSRSEPIGQSVRGGTQTAGQLFLQQNPAIDLLKEALAVAIRDFVGALPPADARHPLLKHRNMGLAFGPSWSVQLSDGGFHAAHFHPGGILSSACYISLPDLLVGNETQSGLLEIGRPPPQFPDLPPLQVIEPKPGRLALFPSFLFHGTRPFAAGERLSVAFDLVPVAMDS